MRYYLAIAAVACAMAGPAVAGKSLNVGGSDVAPAIAVGDLGMAIMSAAINADGTIARGEGVVPAGTQRLSAGVYEVGFGRDITACTYQLTAGESGIGSATPRMVAVTRRSGNNAGLFLQIRDATNAAIDNPFFVLVYCGR